MAWRIEYENTAPSSATSNTTQYVRLYQSAGLTQNAEEGSVGMSTLVIDDPEGALNIVGFRRLRVYEDSASSSNTLVFNGWTADRTIARGPFRTGASRQWVTSLTDQNAVLGYRLMVGADNKRPRESDIARLTWLRGTAEMSTVTESEYIDTTGAVLMDAVDYNGQTPMDIVNDCAQQSGKNYFVYSKDGGSIGATPTLGLFYASAESSLYTSPLRLSNFAADIDSTWTFAISEDTELSRDPSRVYSGAYIQYDGGVVYEQSQTTYVNFTKRDAVVPADNVKSRDTATRRAQRYLLDTNTEDDRITTTVLLPGPKVNFVREGMRIQFRATHLPNYAASYQYLRVVSRTVSEISEVVPGWDGPVYAVQLVLVAGDPALPTLPASAVLYQPKNGGGGGSYPELRYEKTGDVPPSGYPVVPLVGSLEYVSDSVGTGFGAPYKGFRALGAGSLTVSFKANDSGAGSGPITCTPSILVNGVVVASAPHSEDGGIRFHSLFWDFSTTITVSSGDVISTQYSSTWGSGMTVPAGSGEPTNGLRVTGNLT